MNNIWNGVKGLGVVIVGSLFLLCENSSAITATNQNPIVNQGNQLPGCWCPCRGVCPCNSTCP